MRRIIVCITMCANLLMKFMQHTLESPKTLIVPLLLGMSFTLLFAVPAWAAVSVEVKANPENLTIADNFELTVTVRGTRKIIGKPIIQGGGFTILNISSSQHYQDFHGRKSASIVFTHIVKPTRTGTLNIPAVSIKVGNRTYKSRKGVSIQVVDIPRRDDFFMEVTSSKQKLFPEQELIVTLKIYAERLTGRYANQDPFISSGGTWPKLEIPWFEQMEGFNTRELSHFASHFNPSRNGPGFLVNNLTTGVFRDEVRFSFPRSSKRLKGIDDSMKSYYVYTMRKKFQAVKSGNYVFQPITARGILFKSRGTGSNQSSAPKPEKIVVQSKALPITILELPRENRPPTFTGGIGEFSITSRLTNKKEEIWVGEPLTLQLIIRGKGRLESIGPPSLKSQKNIAESFRIHDEPQIGDIDITKGTKIFVYGIRPKNADIESIPSIQFSYFDLKKEEYVTAETDPIPINVQEGKSIGSSDITSYGESPVLRRYQTIRSAIYPIYNKPDALIPEKPPARISWVHIAFVAGSPMAYLLLLLVTLRRRRLDRDPRILRSRDAFRNAKSTLVEALSTENQGKKELAYPFISRALTGFIADRLYLPAMGLTPEESLQALAQKKISSELHTDVKELFEICELARYGSSDKDQTSLASLKDRAENLLKRLDKDFKKLS